MELSYDLHLHSCLSPCGDADMTPGNIAGMAHILGLQVIALTDHNTVRNCPSLIRQAEPYGITVIPGMELSTAEEVHVVCLFAELAAAMEWDRYVYSRLLKVKNREEIFGEQVLMNEKDEPCGTEPNLLINATDISFDEVWDRVHEFGGIMIPAHLDRSSDSLLSNLGFVPPDSKFTCFELRDMRNLHRVRAENPYLRSCRVISCSDAHYLQDMREENLSIAVEANTPEHILRALERAEAV